MSRTFSKIYGMAAMRCGCLFSQAENMATCAKAQSPYSVNSLAAMAARIAVQDQTSSKIRARSAHGARASVRRLSSAEHPVYQELRPTLCYSRSGERAIESAMQLRDAAFWFATAATRCPAACASPSVLAIRSQRFLDELEQIW